RVGGGGGRAVHRLLRRGADPQRHRRPRLGIPRDGASGDRSERLSRFRLRQEARAREDQEGLPLLDMAERVDVLICGSGFGAAISRRRLDPYYARAEAGLRVNQPGWKDVSKSGGLWAATLAAAGYTCDRVPLAISPKRCVNAKWCHTGCIFGAKNSLITNYLPSAERVGVQVRPNLRVDSVRQSSARPYRYVVSAAPMDNEGPSPTRQPSGSTVELECKVL